MPVAGALQDGNSSESWDAQLYLDAGRVRIVAGAREFVCTPQQLQVSDRLGATPRHVSWGGRERFTTRDNDGIDELLDQLGLVNKSRWIAWLEGRLSIAIGAAVLAFAGVILFAIFGVPQVARGVASQVPENLSATLAGSTMTTLDQILDPSELTPERQQQLIDYFSSAGEVRQVAFRKAKRLGANALTLSATHVVFTDELIDLAESDEELLAVYLHELGHARLKHVERSILQSSAWLVLFTVLVGDVSGAGELVVSLPLVVGQMAYSREMEREADQFAVEALLDAGYDPGLLADILEKLEASHLGDEGGTEQKEQNEQNEQPDENKEGDLSEVSSDSQSETSRDKQWSERVFEYLSTHPATDERVRYIRSRSRQGD